MFFDGAINDSPRPSNHVEDMNDAIELGRDVLRI
jgi:hypothetical protein